MNPADSDVDLVLRFLMRNKEIRKSDALRLGVAGLPGIIERIERERGFNVGHQMVRVAGHSFRLEPMYWLAGKRRA